MSEAARSVRHYVSDCLEERHPYDVMKGFRGHSRRDAGRVFDGFQPAALDDLLSALIDSSIDDEQRAKAVHHLYSHSASQETKILLLHKGVVPRVLSILNRPSCVLLEKECFALLRSLCVLPQGCHPVIEGGGVEAAIRAICCDDRRSEREESRKAAAHLIYQIACDPAGRCWLLRTEDCVEMRLVDLETPPASLVVTPSDLVHCAAHILRTEDAFSILSIYAVGTLSQLTMLSPAIHACLADTAVMETLASVLEGIASSAPWQAQVATYVSQLLNTFWNISLDQEGLERLETLNVPTSIFSIFVAVQQSPLDVPLSVQRHVVGALSSLYKLTSMKNASVESCGEWPSRIHALLRYLHWVTSEVDAAKKEGREPCKDIIAVSKNTVQCLRLASEVKAVRDITHAYISNLEEGQPTEAFYLRRQLYYSTRWAAEYDAVV